MKTLVGAAEPPERPLASMHWVPAWPCTTTTSGITTNTTSVTLTLHTTPQRTVRRTP